MKKNAVYLFLLGVVFSIVGVLFFIQSAAFAPLFKSVVSRFLPVDSGIDGDFGGLAIRIFPPGIRVLKPKVVLRERNILRLPAGSRVQAESVDLGFLPFQMLTGSIRIHSVEVMGAEINLDLTQPSESSEAKKRIHLDEFLNFQVDALSIEKTHVSLVLPDTVGVMDFQINKVQLEQQLGKNGKRGFSVFADLSALKSEKIKSLGFSVPLDSLQLAAQVGADQVEINKLEVRAAGTTLAAEGRINGNLFEPKTLAVDLDSKIGSNLLALEVPLVSLGLGTSPLAGELSWNGKIQGNLVEFVRQGRVRGTFLFKAVRFKSWEAEQASVDVAWMGAKGGGTLTIEKGVIESPERARVGGSQPGGGGRIEIGSMKVSLSNLGNDPIELPLKLSRAHLHWVAGPVVRELYPLDVRVSGTVKVSLQKVRERREQKDSWSAHAKLDLAVLDLQLDNQRLGKTKPLRWILKIPSVQLVGEVAIDSDAVRMEGPSGVSLSLGETRLEVDGEVNFKAGFDLRASGHMNLADIGGLAQKPIAGKGPVKIHVHGPTARIFLDFDPELTDASYLGLYLGDLKGRITWDDDPSHLIFSDVQVKKGRTYYLGKGVLDLGAAETAALDFTISEGNVQDLIQIFRNLVKDYWWFPHSLSGPFTGKVHVGGGLDLNLLDVTASFNGEGWDFLGERFRSVALQGGYDRGRVYISSLKSKKRTGEILGRISVDPQDNFDWSFATRGFSVSDLDHVAQLDVPMRGALSVSSEGKGKLGVIQSNSQIALNQVVVRGVGLPPSDLTIRSDRGVTRAQGSALGGQGVLDFSYDFNLGGQSFLRTELKGLDFSPLLLLLNPRMMQDPELAGAVSASAQLSFRSGQLEKGSGKVEIQDYLLAKKGARFHLAHPISFKVTDGSFDLRDLVLKGNNGSARLELRGHDSEIEGRVSGDLDVSVVEFLTSSVSQAGGVADLDFTIGGMLKDPLVFGRANVEGVSVRIPAIESPFENISGAFQLRQNVITVQNLKGDLAGGRVDCDGSVQLFADHYPKVSLLGRIAQTKLKIIPFDYITLNGKLEVKGDEPPYKVKGEVVSDSGLSTMKVLQTQKAVGLKALQYTPPPSLKREGSYPKFVLDIQASADRGIMIRNDLFQAEAKGAVTIVNTLETPRIVGKAELIQGKMVFKDRMFQIESASAVFDNPMEINPTLSLLAHTELSPYKIQLYVSGRMDPLPKIELTSNPVMPESEIISLLTMGLTSSESKRLSSSDRSLIEQGEAASLLLHSLDFNREVQSKTGFEIQLNESVNPQQATSAFRPQSSTEGSAAPKVVIKKSLTKNLDVSAGSTVGVGTGGQREVNAEYKVSPGVSVIGVWDQFETNDSTSIPSYGFDLKLQKRFK